MSTTVSYKGDTIATISNTTKTLTTAGTWLEDDIKITDSSSGSGTAISVVDTVDERGGLVRTITAADISDTTATAADVASGKYFYAPDGTKTAGTNSGGSGPITEITISLSGSVTQQLQPDTVYHFTSEALTDLTIIFSPLNSAAQYHFDFISPATAVSLSLPQSVIMPRSFALEPNTRYELDIVNNYCVFAEWAYEVQT